MASTASKFNSLKRKGSHQSKVWDYFEAKDAFFVKCKVCKKNDIKRAGGTTNMRNHLKLKHPTSFANMMSKECEHQRQYEDDADDDTSAAVDKIKAIRSSGISSTNTTSASAHLSQRTTSFTR